MSSFNQRSNMNDQGVNKRRSNFTNLYVKNFGKEIDETKLCQLFSAYGTITSCKIQSDSNGQSKGFGFVNFERPEMAENAVEKLNGYSLDDGKHLYVAPFQRKSERVNEIRRLQIENRNRRSNNLCLYISNLDTIIDEKQLEAIFSKFGTVTKTHILRNGSQSKGIAFVSFDTIEETTKALNEMNGKWLLSKPLYVKLSENLDNTQLSIARPSPPPSPPPPPPPIPSKNVRYPAMIPIPYFNVPPMFYLPTVMLPTQSNNFRLPIAPPNLQLQPKPTASIREYSSPPPPAPLMPSSTTAHGKRQFYPYTPVKPDD